MKSTANEEIVRRFLALWTERNPEAMAECFAGQAVYDNAPEKKPMEGRVAIKQWLDMVFQHITRIDVEILNIASNGEWVLTERIDDHIADDKHMPLPVMGAARVVDGQIVMFRDYYDRETVRELGMLD